MTSTMNSIELLFVTKCYCYFHPPHPQSVKVVNIVVPRIIQKQAVGHIGPQVELAAQPCLWLREPCQAVVF